MKYKQDTYNVKNTEKYTGTKMPYYRSSWEKKFCEFCDNNPNILKWASESIQIPYFNPVTNKQTIYVPDFLIQYIDKDGITHIELIEIKPSTQTTFESAKSKNDKIAVIVNAAKWDAALKWAQARGIKFKVINEQHIYHTNPKKNNPRIPRKRKK